VKVKNKSEFFTELGKVPSNNGQNTKYSSKILKITRDTLSDDIVKVFFFSEIFKLFWQGT
jgi:hypothetical protein